MSSALRNTANPKSICNIAAISAVTIGVQIAAARFFPGSSAEESVMALSACAPAFIKNIVEHLSSKYTAEESYDEHNARSAEELEHNRKFNFDIQKAVGRTIAKIIRDWGEENPDFAKPAEALAKAAELQTPGEEPNWSASATRAGIFIEEDKLENSLRDICLNNGAEAAGKELLAPAQWKSLLKTLIETAREAEAKREHGGLIAFAKEKGHHLFDKLSRTAGKTGAAETAFDESQWTELSALLAKRFSEQFYIDIKSALNDPRHSRAWAAMQFRILAEIAKDASEARINSAAAAQSADRAAVESERTNASIQVLTENCAEMMRTLLEKVDASERPFLEPMLSRIEEYSRTGAEQATIGVGILQGTALPERIADAVIARQMHAPALDRQHDNLAAAAAGRNENFVGRLQELDRLAQLIEDPSGRHHAVAIVAGAGFGKTELAREFVDARAIPADKREDPAALAPDHWTGRWWLNGSKDGENASLKKHFQIITGRPFPNEPKLSADGDAHKILEKWLSDLRLAVAQACSEGKQLLILDNAENADQIFEYRPGNRGRLIVTTRRHAIPHATAVEFVLDTMSVEDSREILAGERNDLKDVRHAAALDAIARHLGNHALALGYAAAALARLPYKSPQAVLARMQETEIGTEGDLLTEFGEAALGTHYKLGLAQSLGLLLDELAQPASPDFDLLAVDLLEMAAFCDPNAIPESLFISNSGRNEVAVDNSLRALHERSILTLGDSASLHRLTQSLLRGRLLRSGPRDYAAALGRLLDTLTEIIEWREGVQEELADHIRDCERIALTTHAEAAIRHANAWREEQAFPLADPAMAADAAHSPAALEAKAARLGGELALRLRTFGQLATATRHIDAAIAWGEAQNPREERNIAIWRATRANIRRDCGNLEGAEDDLALSSAWFEAQTVREERKLASVYATQALISRDCRELDEAEKHIDKSIAWGERQKPRDERTLAIWRAVRAGIRRDSDDLDGAEADIAKSIAWGEIQCPRDERALAIWRATRAGIRHCRSDLAGAEKDIAGSIAWCQAQSPPDAYSLAIWQSVRSGILKDMKQFDAARSDLQAALSWWIDNLPGDVRVLQKFQTKLIGIDEAEQGA